MSLFGFLKLPDINKGVEEYSSLEGAVLLDVRDKEEPRGCSPPSSSVHGILQERILEWVAISFSR